VRGPDEAASAVGALRSALHTLLRLFAPFLPYATEEVWSWWEDGSVHRASWPSPDDVPGGGDAEVYEIAATVLGAVRKEKALAKVSLRAPVRRVVVRDRAERLAKLAAAEDDVCEAGSIGALEWLEAGAPSIEVELADAED
jgi:valyl-tRNA synthetase